MKKLITLSAIMIILSLLSFTSNSKVSRKKVPKMLDVNLVFAKVYDDIAKALSDPKVDKELIKLSSIDLEFSTTTSLEGGVNAKIYVLAGSYSRGLTHSNKTKFTIGDLSEAKADSKYKPDYDKLTKYIINSIVSAQSIKSIDSYGLKEFEIEVEYTISQSAEGGVEFEIAPITAGLSVKASKEITHTITILFSKNGAAKKS
jgi:hypothetical protein